MTISNRVVATPNSAITIPVLAATADYIVINKPAGVVAHQSEIHSAPDTVVNGLLAMYPDLADVGDDPLRPGLVQRLDQDVSGVMVVARTAVMFEHLKQQFKQHRPEKQYTALVHGRFAQLDGDIRFPIARSARHYTKMAARPDATGKPAITKYTVLKQYPHYALLEVTIVTGRMHQIRVHLNAIGHPVVGETVYVPKRFHSRLQPGRLFLHAEKLRFALPNGEYVQYQAPLPPELQAILDGFH